MKRCLDETDVMTSYAAWKSGDDRLHRTIAEPPQNPLLLTLFDVVHGYVRKLISERMEQAVGQSLAPVENSNDEHAAIVAAIKKRDPEGAERAMRKHLTSIRTLLFGDR